MATTARLGTVDSYLPNVQIGAGSALSISAASLTGTAAGTSVLTGAVTTTSSPAQIVGTAIGQSIANGALRASPKLSATSAGVGGLSGVLIGSNTAPDTDPPTIALVMARTFLVTVMALQQSALIASHEPGAVIGLPNRSATIL